MVANSLRTVAQLARELPAFDEPALRRLIFNAELNGLSRAIVRVGRRVYIDTKLFNEWLEDRRGLPPCPSRHSPAPRALQLQKRLS